jgi:dihydrofolate reductase
MVGLIMAVGENGLIGKDGGLPWKRLPADMKLFKETTMGCHLVVGRKTWDTLPRLDGRTLSVVSRDNAGENNRVSCIADGISDGGLGPPARDVWIIGGAQIYEQSLRHVKKIVLSVVHEKGLQGDTFVSNLDLRNFRLMERSIEEGFTRIVLLKNAPEDFSTLTLHSLITDTLK